MATQMQLNLSENLMPRAGSHPCGGKNKRREWEYSSAVLWGWIAIVCTDLDGTCFENFVIAQEREGWQRYGDIIQLDKNEIESHKGSGI